MPKETYRVHFTQKGGPRFPNGIKMYVDMQATSEEKAVKSVKRSHTPDGILSIDKVEKREV